MRNFKLKYKKVDKYNKNFVCLLANSFSTKLIFIFELIF